MTRQEIKNAINNGESVWCLYIAHKEIEELYLSKNNKYKFEDENYLDGGKEVSLVINYDWYYPLKYLFKTKAEAEHYLHHANVTRTEQLPFLTWEEFNEKGGFDFIGKNLNRYEIIINTYNNKISIYENDEIIKNYDLTEANFYKAYDECVRLFKGGEQL